MIRRVARLGSGHTPSRQHPEYWEDCTIPWMTLADVGQLRDGTKYVVTDTQEMVSEVGVANSSAVVHPAGTVALSRTASVGFSCILGRDMATSQDFATWTCGPQLLPKYLLYALRGRPHEIERRKMGSTHKTIYMPDIETLCVPLPPVQIQQAVAHYLDAETARINALIVKKRRMIELLEEAFLERARHVVTGGMRFGDPLDIRPSEVAQTSWKPLKLAWRLRFGSGTTPPSGDERFYGGKVPWLLTGHLRDDDVLHVETSVIPLALAEFSALRVHPAGSLVVAMYGATVGRLGLTTFDAAVNQACCVIHPSTQLNVRFLFYYLLAQRSVLLTHSVGAGQPNISQEILRSLRIAIPPLEAQDAIVVQLDEARSRSNSGSKMLERQIDLLGEHRQALITAAVTGELQVPGVAA